MNPDEPKISLVEKFMVLATLAVLDLADIALLFAGLDDFFIIDATAFPITQFYFRMKGVRANYMLMSNLLELVPYVGKLPMRTIGAWATIRAANKPESLVAEAVNIGGAVVRKKLQAAMAASEGKTKEGEVAQQKFQEFETLRRKAALERGVAPVTFDETGVDDSDTNVIRPKFSETGEREAA